MKEKFNLSGKEIVSLASSIAICLSEKYEKEDLKKLRLLFQAIASDIATIEQHPNFKF